MLNITMNLNYRNQKRIYTLDLLPKARINSCFEKQLFLLLRTVSIRTTFVLSESNDTRGAAPTQKNELVRTVKSEGGFRKT